MKRHKNPHGESIAVLGAGMLGLTLAWRLAQRGHKVAVIEAADEIGGLTQSFHYEALSWDRFYHVIAAADSELLDLLVELDLDDAVQWRTTRTLFFDGRQHHALDNARDYLRLPALTLNAKLRIALNIIYAGARRQRGGLETISAAQWLTRWSGANAYAQLWAPLLRSKLGSNYERVSAAYIWSVIRRFYGARQGRERTEQFGFVGGGYARILDALKEALIAHDVTLITGSAVDRIEAADAGGVEVSHGFAKDHYDRVIATYASPLLSRSCTTLPAPELARHAAIPYQGVVCLSLVLNRPLGGAYMTYITDNSIPFTTVIEMSALTGTAAYGGHHLVYLPRYVPSDDAIFDSDDAAISERFLPALKRLYPDFEPAQVIASRLARARHVMALPTMYYSAALPPLHTSIAGLYICNSAHIVDASLSVNEAVALANRTVAGIEQNG